MDAHKKAAVFAAGLLALAICMPSVAGASADEAAIRTAGAAWDAAYRAHNVDALVPFYANDAVLMPQTAPTAKGQAAIRKFLLAYTAKLADGGYTQFVSAVVDIDISGKLGFRSGPYSIIDKSGVVVDLGKWLQIWRKVDGKWHIIRDISNSDTLPLFPPERPAAAGGAAN